MKQQMQRDDDSNSPNPSGSFRGMVMAIVVAAVLGLLTVLAYGIRAATVAEYISISATGLLIGGASFGGGGFLGFLFSLPRMPPQKGKASETEAEARLDAEPEGLPAYARNNNLADISDWLTKILVGAGLAQLGSIAHGLQSLGAALAPALGNFPGSSVFAVGIVVYFAVCGFLAIYLWTTLILPPLLRESDMQTRLRRAKSEGREEKEKEIDTTLRQVGQVPQGRRVLWVDDRPENNRAEIELIKQTLGVEVETSTTTSEALERAIQQNFDLVISDMSRPEHPRAGYELLRQLRARGSSVPFVIYSSSARPEHDIEARDRGALGSTNSPVKLLQLTTIALAHQN